jgi:hypothetical protein
MTDRSNREVEYVMVRNPKSTTAARYYYDDDDDEHDDDPDDSHVGTTTTMKRIIRRKPVREPVIKYVTSDEGDIDDRRKYRSESNDVS